MGISMRSQTRQITKSKRSIGLHSTIVYGFQCPPLQKIRWKRQRWTNICGEGNTGKGLSMTVGQTWPLKSTKLLVNSKLLRVAENFCSVLEGVIEHIIQQSSF